MIGQKLKKLRQEKGYSMEKLAELFTKKYNSNYHKSMISNWENGKVKPTINSLKMYTDYFNVSLDWLMDNSLYRNILTQIDDTPLERMHFPNYLRDELYTKIIEKMNKNNNEYVLPKDFNVNSSDEEFWTVLNYMDIDVPASELQYNIVDNKMSKNLQIRDLQEIIITITTDINDINVLNDIVDYVKYKQSIIKKHKNQ